MRKPISPHAALLGRKMGQAGASFLVLSPVFERKKAGVLRQYSEALRRERLALGDGEGKPWYWWLSPQDGTPTF